MANSSHDDAVGCFFFGYATIDIYVGTMAKVGPKAEGEPQLHLVVATTKELVEIIEVDLVVIDKIAGIMYQSSEMSIHLADIFKIIEA